MKDNKDVYKKELRNLFEKVLQERGLSQTQLAKKLNISQPAINEKIRKASWRFIDVLQALNMLGYSLKLVEDTGRVVELPPQGELLVQIYNTGADETRTLREPEIEKMLEKIIKKVLIQNIK